MAADDSISELFSELLRRLPQAIVPEYAIPAALGLAITLLYPSRPTYQDPAVRRGYRILLGVTLVFAVVGAKLSAWMGDLMWPFVPLSSPAAMLASGRSITGGLLLGHLASEIARPLLGYTAPPNDRLAVAVCFGVASGRVGCALAGCCPGIPWDGPFALIGTDGVARVPAPLFEMAFFVVAGVVLWRLERRRVLHGRLFSLLLCVYGVFRFVSEPWRATPKPLAGFSVYQVFAVLLVITGVAGLLWRTLSPVWRARLRTGDR